MTRLHPEKVKPNDGQLQFLTCAANRLKHERRREQGIIGEHQQPEEEPMLDRIHGYPGTSKSKIIKWLRQLFCVLGWQHEVHCVCLAVQSSMAASTDGHTIHHWSGIPVTAQERTIGTKDATALPIKYQCLKFILIDEISKSSKLGRYGRSASMETNACLEASMCCCFGDRWQLKLMAATAVFDSPFGKPRSVQTHLGIFWGQGVNAIHRTHEWTEMVRCKNLYYNAFLTQRRDGSLSAQMYNYIHRFSTLTPCLSAVEILLGPLGRHLRAGCI